MMPLNPAQLRESRRRQLSTIVERMSATAMDPEPPVEIADAMSWVAKWYTYRSGVGIDPADPAVGAVGVWDDDTATYTDLVTGETRPYTSLEQAQTDAARATFDEAAARAKLVERIGAALEANDKFLALTAPTQAQTLAHIKVLTREATALIQCVRRNYARPVA